MTGTTGRRLCVWLLVAAALAGACAHAQIGRIQVGPRPALALADRASDELTLIAAPPDQEVVELVPVLKNRSSGPLTITKLRVTGTQGVPQVAQIVRAALVKPMEKGPRAGTYTAFPPVARIAATCVTPRVVPARGTTLAPGDDPLLLLWLRAVAPGEARIHTLTVGYEQNGSSYSQQVPIPRSIAFEVGRNAAPVEPSPAERACAQEVRFLPGAVQI